MVALQLARPIDDAIRTSATRGRDRFGPQPLADSRHLGEREAMTRIFIPVQAFARYLDGQPAKYVTSSEVLSAMELATFVNSFCPTNILPLINYLRIIKDYPEQLDVRIRSAAKKAFDSMGAILIIQETSSNLYALSP